MHTQNVNVAASESPKTWGKDPFALWSESKTALLIALSKTEGELMMNLALRRMGIENGDGEFNYLCPRYAAEIVNELDSIGAITSPQVYEMICSVEALSLALSPESWMEVQSVKLPGLSDFIRFAEEDREEFMSHVAQGKKILVSAKDLHTRWRDDWLTAEKGIPPEGKHFPSRNDSYGSDVLLLDEVEVVALIAAGHDVLPLLASSARGMTAIYDAGDISAERYIIASRGQIFYRSASWQEACREYLRRASSVMAEEAKKFFDRFHAACDAGLDYYQASDVARGLISLENALNPVPKNQVTAGAADTTLNEIPF